MKPIELLPGCRRVALLCALTAASGTAVAEEAQYEIDPEHAVVAFMVEHIGFARVLGSFTLESSRWSLDGPQAWREQEFRYGNSRLSQRIVVTAGSRRVEFQTRVDWQEAGTMLRAEFPVTVRANECTAEIQFA